MNLPHTFTANTLARAEQVNENFTAVVNEITSQGVELLANISTVSANAASQNATLRSDLEEEIADVQSDLEDAIAEGVGSIHFMPNYSRGVSISFPYTASKDGWVFLVASGFDSMHYVKIQNKKVGASCGYSGGYAVRNGVMCMISKNEVVNGDVSEGMFYPFKGGS